MRRPLALAALALTLCATAASPSHAEERELRVGTLAPRSSLWGKVLQAWQEAVAERTKGALKLTFYWNGSQGDDSAMVDKMRAGKQLDGAALTALGLGKIHRPVLALQIPGLFRTYAAMDRARESVRGEFEQAFEAQGFVLGNLGDVGVAHTMSKGFAVKRPEDLRGRRPVVWHDDVIGPTLFRVIGGVTPVPMSVPQVLPALGNDSVNVVSAPALAATQLQWASKLDHIVVDPGGVTLSGMVFSKASLDALPPDHRETLRETGKITSAALRDRIRKADDQAFQKLKGRMTNVELDDADRAAWAETLTKTVEALGQGTFDPALLRRLADMKG